MRNNKNALQVNELSAAAKTSMRTRIIAGIVGLIPCLACLFIGDWLFFALITAFLAIAVWEILGVCGHRNVPIYLFYFIALALIVYWPIFQSLVIQKIDSWHVYSYFNAMFLPILVLAIGIFMCFLIVVLYEDFTVRDGCFLCAIGLILALGLQSLLYLRYLPLEGAPKDPSFNLTYQNTLGSSWLIIYVLIATFATDIGAYFVGVFFGKNKINERISPKKTWEGFFGGIVISAALSMAFGFAMAYTGHAVVKYLDADHWYNIVVLSLLLPLVATLGDFVFSSIKRYYNIKDYGNLIPGHGGVLDRLDSILFAAITAAVYIYIFASGI